MSLSSPSLTHRMLFSQTQLQSQARAEVVEHDPTIAAHPTTCADIVLIFAGVLLQVCSSESTILNFLLWGTNYQHSDHLEAPFDVQLIGFVGNWFRSMLAMVLLIVVRKLVMANLSPILVSTSYLDTHDGHRMLVQDLLFHLKCRFWVCTLLCLLPTKETVPLVTTNCLVLAVATLSQPVFQQELQAVCWQP